MHYPGNLKALSTSSSRCEQISPLPNWIWERKRIKVDFLLENILLGIQSACLIIIIIIIMIIIIINNDNIIIIININIDIDIDIDIDINIIIIKTNIAQFSVTYMIKGALQLHKKDQKEIKNISN